MPLKTELKVGLYVLVTVLLILTSIGYVAYKKGVFEKVHTYTLSSKSGDDLTEGMPVVFAGFTIGRVQALELSESGSVLIKIRIPERHIKWLRVDSTFIINKPLIGSPRLIIVTENVKSPPLSTKDIREVVTVSDINETIKKAQPLLEKINHIAANIEKMTGHLAGKDSLLEMAVGNPESVNSIHGGLRKVKDITEHVDSLLKKTDAGVYGPDGLLPLVNGILKDLLVKLDKLNKTIDNVNKISTNAADSTADMKLLRTEIDAAVKSIGDLANELDRKIPFKKEPEIKLP